ncbi:hypothetical protein C8J27_11310 [Rhodobacter aestuarii]|uniref:MobA/VirD2-like nuclease domain-containing protein n=1 Tax=Rhodobacter aestuarii TaxID=453582 RepID=A0A1N7QBR3_9RHOB|nr:hypothetical protein [Rhodobacter aestuarii]PTV93645.1 hypothetical protein C8J27_11310 [Rhodobacter aestuarii]SIT19997.1 hypothetical protein SAMN05421580_11510 [Rhodobacter aestuarii]
MRAHNTYHKTAGVLPDYDLRDGAEFIGGTILRADPVSMRNRLDRLADGAGVIHMTLSLPEGLRASRETWHAIVMAQLDLMGLPALRTPWVAARHTDANCDHVHVAIALRGFDGSRLRPETGDIRTSRNHQMLARRLGLPLPDYFNPQIPRFDPPVITRRLTTAPKIRLSEALRNIFTTERPRTLGDLDRALAHQSPAICGSSATTNGPGSNSAKVRSAKISSKHVLQSRWLITRLASGADRRICSRAYSNAGAVALATR